MKGFRSRNSLSTLVVLSNRKRNAGLENRIQKVPTLNRLTGTKSKNKCVLNIAKSAQLALKSAFTRLISVLQLGSISLRFQPLGRALRYLPGSHRHHFGIGRSNVHLQFAASLDAEPFSPYQRSGNSSPRRFVAGVAQNGNLFAFIGLHWLRGVDAAPMRRKPADADCPAKKSETCHAPDGRRTIQRLQAFEGSLLASKTPVM